MLFILSELGNLYTHVYLRSLRIGNSADYVNPQNYLFKNIACPNYSFEILSWIAFTIYTKNKVSIAFTICGFL